MAERKIAGMEIRVDRPLATAALKLQARLMKAAGGIAGQLPSIIGELQAASRADASDAEKQALGVKIIGVLTDVFANLGPEEYAGLVGDIVGMAKIRRQSGHYDQLDLDGDFSTNLGAVIPVCVFVLKEVFGDFFSGALASGGRRAADQA